MPHTVTVADLTTQLQALPGHLPVRLAVTPDFPFTHGIAENLIVTDGIVYIPEDGQTDYLPHTTAEALSWT